MHNKKSQATIYILIGAIILFSAVVIFVFEQGGIEQPKITEITEDIPTEMQPIKSFVEACIQDTSIEALQLIGAHGGYIGTDIDSYVYTGESFRMDVTGIDPTNADALTVSDDWSIPYWWYMQSSNSAKEYLFNTKRPPLYRTGGSSAIESQIDRYVKINLADCLRGFHTFEQKGIDVVNTSGIDVTTTVAQDDVSVFVEYPLEVSYSGGVSKVSQFKVTLDVNLRKMYELASEIMNVERLAYSLETQVLNIISVYSGMDENSLPPMAGTDFSFTSKRWRTSETKDKLENLLAVYINVLQTTNTKGFKMPYFEGDNLKTGLYSGMVIPLEGNYAYIGDTDVSFNYFGWPIYLYITKGEIIQARDTLSVPLVSLLIPIQRYDFPYDVSFPVMVSLHDSNALKGQGYIFIFALEGNIRNNEPVEASYFEMNQERDTSASADQLCSPDQLNSEDVTFSTVDPVLNPAPGVQVLFSVGNTGCGLGETEIDESGQAVFRGKVPKGAIGSLVLIHPDYETYIKFPFRGNDTVQNLGTIKLNKYVMKNASAVKININKNPLSGSWDFIPVKRPLTNKEHVIVMLQKYKTTPYDDDTMTAIDVNGTHTQEIRLAPGKYKMDVTLIQENATIIIPRETYCTDDNSWDLDDCDHEDHVGPTTVANNAPFVAGQYSKNITISNEIYFDNTVEFTALNFNLKDFQHSSVHEDLERWSKNPNYNANLNQNEVYFRPEYKPTS